MLRAYTASALRAQISHSIHRQAAAFSSMTGVLSKFATVDPVKVSASSVHHIENCCDGVWGKTKETFDVLDPMNGEVYIKSPKTQGAELEAFVTSLKKCPKSGRHNMLKNPERFLMYGKVMQRAAALLNEPEVFDFFVKTLQRVMPKSTAQCVGEVKVVRAFIENFSGDNVRFLMRGFSVAGDHNGQQSNGFRWPYGPVAIISPFNFPLEIPILQVIAAAMVGNKPVLKCEATMGLPVEQFIRFLQHCGLPKDEIDLISCRGPQMSQLVEKAKPRMLQFTGSSQTADVLNKVTKGRMRTEDSGFDWKILGPDVSEIDYVAWQSDQDAYAMSGQKCSAQSMLICHSNWVKQGFYEKIGALAARRSFKDLTCSPVLSHTSEEMVEHVKMLAGFPGGRVLFGGKPLEGHRVPDIYGTLEPTAVFIPLDSILKDEASTKLVCSELFGPVQVVTEWKDGEENKIIELCERMEHHLTAGVVSTDPMFLNRVLANTVNGVTYAGLRARTTGAPQNHWFGPAGDPMAAGIGSPEAILTTWTCHREIIYDHGPVPKRWTTPPAS